MSNTAFIKLRPTARISYLGYRQGENIEAVVHPNHYCLNISVLSVKDSEGKEVSSVQPNQSFTVNLGHVEPPKYTVLLTFPLELQQAVQGLPGTVIVESGDSVDMSLKLKAIRKLNLQDLKFFARMYLME